MITRFFMYSYTRLRVNDTHKLIAAYLKIAYFE